MNTEERDWYDTPAYYDIVFDEETSLEGDFLEAVHEKFGTARKVRRTLLEPACGSGRLIAEMARRGWDAQGFDGSPAMLEYARERLTADGLTAHLWEDRMEDFHAPGRRKFDLAHCLVSTFKYLRTEDDALACLRGVAARLRKGGVFVLGLHLSDYENRRAQHERWVGQRDGIKVVCNTRTWPADRRQRREKLRTRLQISRGRCRNPLLQETHWEFRTYDAAQLRRLLRKAAVFEVAACYDFHYDLDSPRKIDDDYADIVLVLRLPS